MYKNALEMMPSVLNSDPILSVLNATGVPNVQTVPNVPKMAIIIINNVKIIVTLSQKNAAGTLYKTLSKFAVNVMNDSSVPKIYLVYQQKTLSVPTGVPNVKCTKVQ